MEVITHYTKLNTLLNFILENNTFRLNMLSQTNDPFEYSERTCGLCHDGSRQPETSEILEIMDEILKYKIKVGCFVMESSKQSSNYSSLRSIINVALWAHYGDNHNGVAIVFDKEKLLQSCRLHIPGGWAFFHEIVSYNEINSFSNTPYEIHYNDIGIISESNIAKHIFEKSKKILVS